MIENTGASGSLLISGAKALRFPTIVMVLFGLFRVVLFRDIHRRYHSLLC